MEEITCQGVIAYCLKVEATRPRVSPVHVPWKWEPGGGGPHNFSPHAHARNESAGPVPAPKERGGGVLISTSTRAGAKEKIRDLLVPRCT